MAKNQKKKSESGWSYFLFEMFLEVLFFLPRLIIRVVKHWS
ncbi:hypothetical protein [Alkalihalobacterium elongatum]|nr:hypothetical protein [Alkalihalobacterium elongatum]